MCALHCGRNSSLWLWFIFPQNLRAVVSGTGAPQTYWTMSGLFGFTQWNAHQNCSDKSIARDANETKHCTYTLARVHTPKMSDDCPEDREMQTHHFAHFRTSYNLCSSRPP